MAFAPSALNAFPIPRYSVLARTVTRSSFGRVWGITLNPSGSLARTTDGPSFDGSPSSTTIFAPVGRDGGPSAHLASSGVTIRWSPRRGAGRRTRARRAIIAYRVPRNPTVPPTRPIAHPANAAGQTYDLGGHLERVADLAAGFADRLAPAHFGPT